MTPKDRLIVALDVDNAHAAVGLVERLHSRVGAFKVGLELMNSAGIEVFARLAGAGASRLFYDAKLHDIPNTVAGASRAIARKRLWMMNVHAAGGSRMIRAASDGLRSAVSVAKVDPPLLVAVTLLTSLSADELSNEMRVNKSPVDYVTSLARMAQDSGADGVVASPEEIEAIRKACGPEFLIVTPGIRPSGSDQGDQRRTMTPSEAIQRGADYLVIGRPITAAPDPTRAVELIVGEMTGV